MIEEWDVKCLHCGDAGLLMLGPKRFCDCETGVQARIAAASADPPIQDERPGWEDELNDLLGGDESPSPSAETGWIDDFSSQRDRKDTEDG